MPKVSVIGLGLMGCERLKALKLLRQDGRPVEIAGVHDPYNPKASAIAAEYGTSVLVDMDAVFSQPADWFVVSLPHDAAASLVPALLQAGKKVFVEKPLGRSLEEARAMASAARSEGQLRIGFNYRFFAGISAMLRDLKAGRFGRIVSMDFFMGHGCSPDITKGWKLDLQRAGGGCLIDPGIHLLDLCRVFAGDIAVRDAVSWRGFWNTGIEEECHLLLEGGGTILNVRVSIVHWRSEFKVEVNGTEGYGRVSGRGRSYGPQRYVRGRRWGWQQAPSQEASEETVVESDGADVLAKEMDELLFPSQNCPSGVCTPKEALAAMTLMKECYDRMGETRARK